MNPAWIFGAAPAGDSRVQVTCEGFPILLLSAVQAAALRDALTKALEDDHDKTPLVGNRSANA